MSEEQNIPGKKRDDEHAEPKDESISAKAR